MSSSVYILDRNYIDFAINKNLKSIYSSDRHGGKFRINSNLNHLTDVFQFAETKIRIKVNGDIIHR